MKTFLFRFVLIFICLLVLVGIFSATESRFKCSGVIRDAGPAREASLNVRFTQYRWWVKLWNDSDGMLKVEIPGGHTEWFLYLDRAGDQYMIARDLGIAFSGHYSSSKRYLNLITSDGEFAGQCKLL